MTVRLVSGTGLHGIFTGLSTDTKPTTGEGVAVGAKFFETDTLMIWRYDGSVWVPRAKQLTKAQITADQNNYDIETSEALRISSDASRTITGFVGGSSGRVLRLYNVGANDIIIAHQNVSSTAANRVITTAGSDFTLSQDTAMYLEYDATTLRWRQLGDGGDGQDEDFYAESEGISTTTSATFQDKTTLTFTPTFGGDYMIWWSCEYRNTSAANQCEVQLEDTTATATLALSKWRNESDALEANVHAIGGIKEIALSASVSQTLKLQWRRPSGSGSAEIRRARIYVARKVN